MNSLQAHRQETPAAPGLPVHQYRRGDSRTAVESRKRLRHAWTDGEKDPDTDNAPYAAAVLLGHPLEGRVAPGDDQPGAGAQASGYHSQVPGPPGRPDHGGEQGIL